MHDSVSKIWKLEGPDFCNYSYLSTKKYCWAAFIQLTITGSVWNQTSIGFRLSKIVFRQMFGYNMYMYLKSEFFCSNFYIFVIRSSSVMYQVFSGRRTGNEIANLVLGSLTAVSRIVFRKRSMVSSILVEMTCNQKTKTNFISWNMIEDFLIGQS